MIRDWSKINTLGDIMREARNVFKTGDKEEGKKFMDEYLKVTEHANENIGYMCGYEDRETMKEMLEFFDVYHPIFGRCTPSAETSVRLGMKMATKGQ